MRQAPENSFWHSPAVMMTGLTPNTAPHEFERLWLGFMTARVTLGIVFVLLQSGIFLLSSVQRSTPLLICVAYLIAALIVRLTAQPQQLDERFDGQWMRTVGVDVVTFAALQIFQNSGINYTPLFALPVLMASILGSMLLATGAAAGVTLLLFAYAAWLSFQTPGDASTHFLQAALTGAACFAISFVASQLAMRLASVELRAQHSQLAATVQRQVNELVIKSLTDAILVVDERGQLRSANPAARQVLGLLRQAPEMELNLNARPGWQALRDVVAASFSSRLAQQSDIAIEHAGAVQRSLWVRTQLTAPLNHDAQVLCVVFMQDQREIQARIRAEKLAGMGRMSAAVAHEIRNPLAAIMQANALLAEDLTDPVQLRLATMVQQNALRLEKIVCDVLHLTHAPTLDNTQAQSSLDLTATVRRICRDWSIQNKVSAELLMNLPPGTATVIFDPEHLRRILINLLDNARRYASGQAGCMQISANIEPATKPPSQASLFVWSDGAPLEPAVEQHLFEPFFSSESRSSGLGLYICRELCASNGATISYGRRTRSVQGENRFGNEFSVVFKSVPFAIQPGKEPA
ncbi:MAG: PAS domain-containing protein [Ilumatobacteraceae bacterium]|jgi:two-component system sensor histidine kinase PilS (NtrC family)|nr:PAS domain-containing protein [Ilumatobacteraceae bacterium]